MPVIIFMLVLIVAAKAWWLIGYLGLLAWLIWLGWRGWRLALAAALRLAPHAQHPAPGLHTPG